MRTLGVLVTALALAGVVITGCSSSSNNGPTGDGGFPDGMSHKPDGKAPKDGGPRKETGPKGDGTTPMDSTTPMEGSKLGMDASEGGNNQCTFAGFVKGLIANDTTATALPSTDLGQNCTDNPQPGDFPPPYFQ